MLFLLIDTIFVLLLLDTVFVAVRHWVLLVAPTTLWCGTALEVGAASICDSVLFCYCLLVFSCYSVALVGATAFVFVASVRRSAGL